MATKKDLRKWLLEALRALGGRASIVDICKFVWEKYKSDLNASDDLFYTWQYDIRWQATYLRKEGVLVAAKDSPQGIWELKSN